MALFHSFDVLTNTRGDSLVGYQVLVRQTGGGSVVPIYGDISGTPIIASSGIANVALTDDAGNWSFFVQTGTYDLEFRRPTGEFVKTVRNVPLQNGEDGEKGDPGSDPMVDEFAAAVGDTTFQPTFDYAPSPVVVFINGLKVPPTDYTAAGGDAPLVFNDPFEVASEVSFHSFLAGGDGNGGAVPTPALDELSLSDFPRLTGETQDINSLYRLSAAAASANKRMFAPPGSYVMAEGGQALANGNQGVMARDDFRLRGAGIGKTIITGLTDVGYVLFGNKQPRGTVQSPSITEPGSANSIKRAELSHMTLRQPFDLFLESSAVIGLFGITDFYGHDLKIEGMQGDAFRFSMAEFGDGSQQGHNRNVTLERVIVDGLGNYSYYGGNNRQGVTIEDIDTYTERDCTFLNLTRPGNGNVTPAERDKPNTGPPMPGAGDIEFISASIFDVRARNTLVERRTVRNSGGAADVMNFAKGNRTTTIGGEAADIAVLIQNHRRVGISAERCRLGLFTIDAPPQAAVGFDMEYRSCEASVCGRPFEVTRVRGLRSRGNRWYKIDGAGALGYVLNGYYARDVDFDGDTWEQTGLTEGLTIALFQGQNVSLRNQRVINCNGTWLRISGPAGTVQKTTGLTVTGTKVQNDGLSGLPSLTQTVLVVPESGESLDAAINRLIDLPSTNITGNDWGTASGPNFASPGGRYPNAFRHGDWKQDAEVYCTSTDPGAPIGWRVVADSVQPALPRLRRFGTKGLPASDIAITYTGPIPVVSSGVIVSGNSRYESVDANQQIVGQTNVNIVNNNLEWIVRGLFNRTAMVFIGARPSSVTTPGIANFTGVWYDGGFGGSGQRVAYINGAQAALQGSFTHDQFCRIRLYKSSGFGPVLRIYTGTTENGPWTPAGAPMALAGDISSMTPYILFGSSGESLNPVALNTSFSGGADT